MSVKIGISTGLEGERKITLSQDNVDAVVQAGGLPFLLPNLWDASCIPEMARELDGLLLTGGGDIDPTLFGEEPHPKLGTITPRRDFFEYHLIRLFLEQNKPVLAICRGCQILNVAAGGDMYQDIGAQHKQKILQHTQLAPRAHASHYVQIEQNSLLFSIIGKERIKVNSFHHQAIRRPAPGFEVSGWASDGVIEAFESKCHRFILGIQWHPECMAVQGVQDALKLFRAFVHAASQAC
ncbi:gamma-glutamyl-gamma-aminobutyrate hydrolase family protein [Caldalkalibacillus thermarum TA2.A1]|uniref:Gamma-glutamyl-gamma-aminobutyrate hydrolase family protein n=1 Tax=Caldalkalibacillus thermarum (strain TA2.A1) TaxID=986075 RepID=A0A8X8L9X6_CALTT|nr:gamma-glutamyl-gamma-aminobutyrate hydrolase family protein [Caldalkalibacillus thermarum]QZT33498.1 gamma-glutamyl-gamma-aminobutyrate hydrolase family protein [Caldalkalibacillus thermarum TA2.A1]